LTGHSGGVIQILDHDPYSETRNQQRSRDGGVRCLPRKTRDIRLVQRFARHVNIHTTTIYAQPSEEDLMRAVRELPC
jgi:hypothetical protein